jgi:hypothetical protein
MEHGVCEQRTKRSALRDSLDSIFVRNFNIYAWCVNCEFRSTLRGVDSFPVDGRPSSVNEWEVWRRQHLRKPIDIIRRLAMISRGHYYWDSHLEQPVECRSKGCQQLLIVVFNTLWTNHDGLLDAAWIVKDNVFVYVVDSLEQVNRIQ